MSIMNIRDIRLRIVIHYSQFAADVVLIVAIGLGMYTQWTYTKDNVIVAMALFGLFVFAFACFLQFYFNFYGVSKTILHIWIGCLLGVLIFMDMKQLEYISTQEVMDILFISSLVMGCLWNLLSRILHIVEHKSSIFCNVEIFECVGLIISTLVTGKATVPISLLIIAFILNTLAIRFKSLLGVICFIALIIITSSVFFKDLNISINIYGLVCVAGRHAFPPLIDLYFSGLSMIERWEAFFEKSKIIRHLTVLCIFFANITLGILVGDESTNHKEWFVVVPIYVAVAIVWLCFQIIFFITCWQMLKKLTDCYATYNIIQDERKNITRIMSSKGVRHYSLISQRFILLALVTTVLIGAIGWTTRTGYSLSLLFIILPIQCMTLSLFSEFGTNLGGICTGYALIAPTSQSRIPVGYRSPNGTKLLSPQAFQDLGARATSTLNAIQRFFSFSMIDNFGCDFSTSGLSFENVESKLKTFFEHKTIDGPRYDTYILYYCGDVYETGDWALTGERNLKLDTILEWWSTRNFNSGARLILVMDTRFSHAWARDVRRFQGGFVALQTCKFLTSKDPEASQSGWIGNFTHDWVHYNLDAKLELEWHDPLRTIKAVTSFSKYWSDFQFHMPTYEDIQGHWELNFPKCTKPLIRVINLPVCGGYNIFCCCDCVIRCLRRKRMLWLPPKEMDTGHGFKLVRS